MLEVSDMGKGIPEKDLPYVFERFYRANETRAARGSASR
jgi:two-component system, OmpR family, sensor histidine kinase ResE